MQRHRLVPIAALVLATLPAMAAPAVDSRLVVVGRQAVDLLIGGEGGPAVVFFSGMGEAGSDWLPFIERLIPCVRTVAWDRPGIGRSLPAPAEPVDPLDVAALFRDALAAAEVSPPYVVVGHSMGGLYAQAFARLFPERVAGLLLDDAVMTNEPDGVFLSLTPPASGTPDFFEEAGEAAGKRAVAALPPPALPVIVLTATDHGDTPEREALWRSVHAEGAAAYPAGRQVLVEGSGHFIHHDRPEAMTTALAELMPERAACLAGR